MPTHFVLKPIEKTESKLKVLLKLIKRKDIDRIINGCDAGREGELIFRYIVQHSKSKKPIERLWLRSMTPTAIRDGFNHLRSDQQMQPLAAAAVCRSESDWLVGINGTRAMTAFNSKSGGFQLTTVGRVQTPTLTIVVEREERIKKFVPRKYWELHATFDAEKGEYLGRWFDEEFSKKNSKEKREADPDLKPERLWDRQKAESIREQCLGKRGEVSEERKPSHSIPPLLYDLTSLQREANSRFGFPASMTLKIAQALYEKHKVLTYPRTDARALPEDYQGTVRQTLQTLSGTSYGPFADQILNQNWVRPNKRVFDNSKVSDHFAIIPTSLAPKKLNEDEAKLYDLVTKRFLAVFYPPAEYMLTTRITRVENHAFKTEGKVLVKPGWLEVYGKDAHQGSNPNLTPVSTGEKVLTKEIEVQDLQTKPPPRFSEATLLSAMEGAGKLVDDEELREAMSAKGLGTPATRAAIIDGLLHEKYLVRQAKELQPTAKAISLITLLRGLGIPELCSPELTGDWEFQLKQMEQAKLDRPEFMKKIETMTRNMVDRAKQYESDTVPGDFGVLQTPCPKCGGEIRETYKKFQCGQCDFSPWKILASRQLEIPEMEELLRNKVIGPLQGFRSKMGRPFAALIKLEDDFKVSLDFGQNEKEESDSDLEVDFSGKEPLGACPKCQSHVFENGMSYTCEHAVGKNKSCDFRSGVVILQRTIEKEQMTKLLASGKTDLLHKFVSKKTGRPFSAFLVLKPDGKVGFEFAPREPKSKASSKKAASKQSKEMTKDVK